MKTILIAFDGSHGSSRSIEYAADVAKSTKSLLMAGFIADRPLQSPNQTDQNEIYWQTLRLCEHICRDKNVPFIFHEKIRLSLSDLVDESASADLLIVDTNTDSLWYNKESSDSSLYDIIGEAHCPVITLLSRSHEIKSVLMTNDEKVFTEFAAPIFN